MFISLVLITVLFSRSYHKKNLYPDKKGYLILFAGYTRWYSIK